MTRTPVADVAMSTCGHATSGCPDPVPPRPIPAGHAAPSAAAAPPEPAVPLGPHVSPGPAVSRGLVAPGGVGRFLLACRSPWAGRWPRITRFPCASLCSGRSPSAHRPIMPTWPGSSKPAATAAGLAAAAPRVRGSLCARTSASLYPPQWHAATLFGWSFDPGRDS
jgi:hypothetical protein